MSMSLKKTITVTVVVVFLVMSVLLVLGFRQYRANLHHQKIVVQTQKVIFQFAIIREHLNESILTGEYDSFVEISQEMEFLRQNLAAIVENAHVPDEYKLTFLNQIDLPGIILMLRDLRGGEMQVEEIRKLNQETRILGERLMLFDRVLINYSKKSLIALQSIIIGALAITVFALIISIITLYRRMAGPIMGLARQAGEIIDGSRAELTIGNRCLEIDAFTGLTGELLREREKTEKETRNCERIQSVAVRILNIVHDAENSRDLLPEVCRGFLENEDYCLVWIGVADQESGQLKPLAVDGSTTMTCDEYSDCLKTLCELVEKGVGNNDQGHEALHSGRAVAGRDILSGFPQGPFKNTPFHREKVSSLSLPMLNQGKSSGVITIYTVQPGLFDDKEISVLQALANSVAFTIDYLERICGREERFRASQLAAVGELAADVAHEINNLSNGIINYAQIIADEAEFIGLHLEHGQLLGKVIQEGERIAAISNRLLACSEEPELENQHFRIDQVVQEALGLINHRLRNDGIEVRKYLQDEIPAFTGNRQKILHLFLNLFNNAWQALNKRFPGKDQNKLLEIRNELVREGDRELIRYSITDHGAGISEEEMKRVFDADFTTRPHGAGSGLGLTISREIILAYGGEIKIDSEVGDHTMVIVDFPL